MEKYVKPDTPSFNTRYPVGNAQEVGVINEFNIVFEPASFTVLSSIVTSDLSKIERSGALSISESIASKCVLICVSYSVVSLGAKSYSGRKGGEEDEEVHIFWKETVEIPRILHSLLRLYNLNS